VVLRNIGFVLATFEYSMMYRVAAVEILAIVAKSEAGQWLAEFANPT
jgi:hypothetical protein